MIKTTTAMSPTLEDSSHICDKVSDATRRKFIKGGLLGLASITGVTNLVNAGEMMPESSAHSITSRATDEPTNPQCFFPTEKYALLIGNGNYAPSKGARYGENQQALVGSFLAYLQASKMENNPGAEINVCQMHDSLEALNFKKVIVETDLDYEKMKLAVKSFASLFSSKDMQGKAKNGQLLVLFYFNGHALQQNGRNYLLPIGANYDASNYYEEMIELQSEVLDKLPNSSPGLTVAIVDACRTDHSNFTSEWGLSQVEPEPGTLVFFSQSARHEAYGSSSRNEPSIFTKALHSRLNLANTFTAIDDLFNLAIDDCAKESIKYLESTFNKDRGYQLELKSPREPEGTEYKKLKIQYYSAKSRRACESSKNKTCPSENNLTCNVIPHEKLCECTCQCELHLTSQVPEIFSGLRDRFYLQGSHAEYLSVLQLNKDVSDVLNDIYLRPGDIIHRCNNIIKRPKISEDQPDALLLFQTVLATQRGAYIALHAFKASGFPQSIIDVSVRDSDYLADLIRSQRGDKDAAFRIGRMYGKGDKVLCQNGVPDMFKMECWLKFATELGNGTASHRLAEHYGDEKRLTEAAHYQKRARDLGYVPGPHVPSIY